MDAKEHVKRDLVKFFRTYKAPTLSMHVGLLQTHIRGYNKQPPRSTRRNALPVKLIDGSLLMGHQYLACALV